MTKNKNMDLLAAVEQIVSKAMGSGLSSEFYRKADRAIRYVSEKMDLTREQAVLMALFIDNSDDSSILIGDICKFLDCRTTRILMCMNDIDVLEKRELIRCSREGKHMSYRVPFEVVQAFRNDVKYAPKDCSGLSIQELFGEIENIFGLRNSNELTYEATAEKIKYLFDCNGQLLYVQKVRSYNLPEDEEMLLILFSHLFVNNNDDCIRYHDLDFLFDKHAWYRIKGHLSEGSHILQREKMIEFSNSGGFADRDSFCMTTWAKRQLFKELNLLSLNENIKRGDLIMHSDINPKRLFYDDKVSSRIEELGSLLDPGKYNQVHDRMKEAGFRCGFACLFYGEPGTGKTETALQLARQTGRDILQVNISQIKSMWVGESEKNIKQIFDNYRSLVSERRVTPVLLFNEADAIIGKRQEGAERAVDKMENSLQNIILQEMETLDGILIATTNLAQNMDKAFERRFLYKIKFERPTAEARMSMWTEMIPALKEEDVRYLAAKYDFSGGQIENIARHYTIGNILHGATDDMVGEIAAYCESERLVTKEIRKIGFFPG